MSPEPDKLPWPPEGTREGSAYHAGFEAGLNAMFRQIIGFIRRRRNSHDLQELLLQIEGDAAAATGTLLQIMRTLDRHPEALAVLPDWLVARTRELLARDPEG